MLAAAVDLGTNTFRLLLAEVEKGRLRALVGRRETVRLGEGLAASSRLRPEAVTRGLRVLDEFRLLLADWPGCRMRFFGTEALRRAENRDEFLLPAARLLGHPVEVLSGRQEAVCSLRGAMHGLRGDWPNSFWLVDVGGGSSELVLAGQAPAGPEPLWLQSLPLGAVVLHEGWPPGQDRARHVAQVLSAALAQAPESTVATLLATGGSASAAACLHLRLEHYQRDLVDGLRLSADDLAALAARLEELTPEERNALPCLGQGRGEILPAGIAIFQGILATLQLPAVTICESGFLEGAVLAASGED